MVTKAHISSESNKTGFNNTINADKTYDVEGRRCYLQQTVEERSRFICNIKLRRDSGKIKQNNTVQRLACNEESVKCATGNIQQPSIVTLEIRQIH